MPGSIEIGKNRKISEFSSKHSIESKYGKVKYATVLDNRLTNIKILG